ncbi:ROK family protein [Novosphingobium terrae]|uniref:ROK family protein n=1 Tax=Novosphingobium terrae TaxID=2726189 RepID=UPI00197D1B62|nr:ROK family protein [Novosphingobium terrae]
MTMFGAVEAGGTKFVCAVGSASGGSLRTTAIPTRDPDTTFADIAGFFRQAGELGPLAGVGLASFGPIGLDPAAPTYGHILATTKPGWEGTNMVARLRDLVDVPVALDTDVNAAALAEVERSAEAIRNLAYVTIGTGIGVGLVVDGRTVKGFGHPEVGHALVRRHPAHGDFPGTCRFHGDCLEGLAAGPAVAAAWPSSGQSFAPDHPFWAVESDYIAQLCMTLILTSSPERIVLGGGVMQQEALFPLIRARTLELLGGYVHGRSDMETMERLIVPPVCNEPPGLVGAYLLAEHQ